MSANDNFDCVSPLNSDCSGSNVEPRPEESNGLAVAGNVKMVRMTPLPYPDAWGEDEEFEPIDVHSLNVASGEFAFTFSAKFYDAGKMEPLPYPDPLADRDEGIDD